MGPFINNHILPPFFPLSPYIKETQFQHHPLQLGCHLPSHPWGSLPFQPLRQPLLLTLACPPGLQTYSFQTRTLVGLGPLLRYFVLGIREPNFNSG